MVTQTQVGDGAPTGQQGPNDQSTLENLQKAQDALDQATGGDNANNGNDDGANEGGDDGQDQRPEWLPEKFKSPEDLAKAYNELQTKLSQGKSDGTPKGDDKQTQQQADDAASKAVDQAGLDMESLQQEFSENGELKAESYEALEKAGIPRHMVDNYVKGQQAVADAQLREVHDHAGGEAKWNATVEWARANLSESDLKAYNDAVAKGGAEAVRAAKGLQDSYVANNGKSGTVSLDGKNNGQSADVYESWAQVTADMNDSRYREDPAFQKQVRDKLGRSRGL